MEAKKQHDDTFVREVMDAEFPEWEVADVQDISDIMNMTYIVSLDHGEDVILTYCDRHDYEDWFASDPVVLEYVAEHTDVPVPEVLFRDCSKETYEYMVYVAERVPGYDPDARFKFLPIDDKRTILRSVGEYLADLHDQTFDSFGSLVNDGGELAVDDAGDWETTCLDIVERQLAGLEGGPFESEIDRFRDVIDSHRHLLDVDDDPVLLHHDLRPANTLVEDGDVSGVIDWERALAGHAEYDLFETERNYIDIEFDSAEAQQRLRDEMFDVYENHHDLSPGWEARRALYRVIFLSETMWYFPQIPYEALRMTEEDLRDELDHRIERLEELA